MPVMDVPDSLVGPTQASKAETVYRTLRDQIVRLKREPGAFIDKAEVCEALQVSRFPVANALSRLARERLVDVEPQRGSYVSLIRLTDVREAIVMRTALESEAARQAAMRPDPGVLKRIDEAIEVQRAMHAVDDGAGFTRADEAFHYAICGATNFPRLLATVASARAHMERLNLLLSVPVDGRMLRTLDQHDGIVAAIRTGDVERAGRAMRIHLESLGDDVDGVVARQPDYFRA